MVVDAQVRLRSYEDLYGNRCTRVVLPMGRSTFRYAAEIDVPDLTEDVDETAREIAPDDVPDDTLIYTLPSRYCLPDVLGDEAWALFGAHAPGYPRVQTICDRVHSHVTFRYGSSTAWSTATEINSTRLGVCRDFTHLASHSAGAGHGRYVLGYLRHGRVDARWTSRRGWRSGWLIAGGPSTRNNTTEKGRVVIGGAGRFGRGDGTTFGAPT